MTITQTEGLCDVCTHGLDTHDRIATRFCQATRTNALTRACICSAVGIPAAKKIAYRS